MNIVDKIKQYKKAKDKQEEIRLSEEERKRQALVDELLSLQDDIAECMAICRECVASGIRINNYIDNTHIDEATTFATDFWHHRVGYKDSTHFGKEGGGACGEFAGVEFNDKLTKMKVIFPEGEDYKIKEIIDAFKNKNFKQRLIDYVEDYIAKNGINRG